MSQSFAERIDAALDTYDAEEAAKRSQSVVAEEISALDAGVTPRMTGYFNHSFIPDMVLEWSEGGNRLERELFVRHSLLSSEAAGDWAALGNADDWPIFISIAADEPQLHQAAKRARRQVKKRSRALLTSVAALQSLVPGNGETGRESPNDPLAGIVRGNIIRGARGFIDAATSEKLSSVSKSEISDEVLADFRSAVKKSFDDAAQYRISRVESIVRAAVDIESDWEGWEGVLSSHEVETLLPYLLTLEQVQDNRDFWTQFGRLLTLSQVEAMWELLDGLDLTPLASASAPFWQGKYAQLAIRSEVVDDPQSATGPYWQIVGRGLAGEVGQWRAGVYFNGQKVKGRDRSAPARWDDVKDVLENYDLVSVDLHGVSRRMVAGSDGSLDVREDVEHIISTLDDSFHVPALTVRAQDQAGDAHDLRVDFTTNTIQAGDATPVDVLVHAAVSVLGYRYPPDEGDLEVLLGSAADETVDESDGNDG